MIKAIIRSLFGLILPLLILIGLAASSQQEMLRSYHGHSDDKSQAKEVLYLPSGTGLRFISFGFNNALSQLLWFNTINYFGKHYAQERDYRWLAHMCNLVTDLNPQALHVFRFCSLMLAWEANAAAGAVELLGKAIEHHPDNWELFYLRAITRLIFLKDNREAKNDLIQAARLPDAHPLVVRLAAREISSLDHPTTALQFLEEIIATTEDPSARHALRSRADEIEKELQKWSEENQ